MTCMQIMLTDLRNFGSYLTGSLAEMVETSDGSASSIPQPPTQAPPFFCNLTDHKMNLNELKTDIGGSLSLIDRVKSRQLRFNKTDQQNECTSNAIR